MKRKYQAPEGIAIAFDAGGALLQTSAESMDIDTGTVIDNGEGNEIENLVKGNRAVDWDTDW